ncbi:MAG: hypothetical protein L6R39_001294 [Caloplaca ligustica]|nr:MAG: hypothetical protein L6R39_001294 [Caloplaca ligustica]
MALLIASLVLPCNILAAPSIGLPLNAQAPPIARPFQPFSFVFADTTFSSSTGKIDYALANAPGWLQLDKTSRALSGTPGSSDDGSAYFGLVATDITGSTTMPVTLVVSSSPGPGLGKPLEDQLSTRSNYQSPNTILLPHSSALMISFSPDTFTNTDHETEYYALCANNTPLPSWIVFEPLNLSFAGTAPQNTSPDELPQTFDLHFTASDVPGFSDAVVSFSIVLENHILTFGNQPHIVNVTSGVPFIYDGLQHSLALDDQTADRAGIREIHADTPYWVSFDESSWILSGTPPASIDSQNITVTATDLYGENATTTVALRAVVDATAHIFEEPLGTVNATIGVDFVYTFNRSIAASSGINVSVDLAAASSWLRFDGSSLELSGRVPGNLSPQDIIINITAAQGSRSQSESLTISIGSLTHSNSLSTSAPSTSVGSGSNNSTPTSTVLSQALHSGRGSHSHRSKVAAAVAVPIVMLCVFLLFACLFVYRRRRREKTWLSAARGKISRPFLSDEASDKQSVGEMVEKPAAAHRTAPSKPPIIDLPGLRSSIASKRRSFLQLFKAPTEDAHQAPKTEYTEGLSMGKPKPAAQPQFSLVPQEQESSRMERSSLSSRNHPLRNSRPSGVVNFSPAKRKRQRHRISDMSSDPFSSQRVSGFGHGRDGSSFGTSCWGWGPTGIGHGNGGRPDFGRVSYSWRDPRHLWRDPSMGSWTFTNSSIKSSDKSLGGYAEITLEQPNTVCETGDEKRWSIRAVPSEGSQNYGRPLHEYLKRRAHTQHRRNTFFAAGPSSRATSRLNWVDSVHLPIFSPTQSMRSFGAKRYSSMVERDQTHTQRSNPGSPTRASPSKSRPPSRGLANLISSGITNRLHSSRGSTSSSQRSASAAEDSDVGLSPSVGLEEGKDEEGNRRWTHIQDLSQHSPTTSGAGDNSDMREAGGLGSSVRATDGMGSYVHRLRLLRQQGGGGRQSGGRERRFVVGSRGKRPVSVDNGLMARGPSMRADLVDEGESAFV